MTPSVYVIFGCCLVLAQSLLSSYGWGWSNQPLTIQAALVAGVLGHIALNLRVLQKVPFRKENDLRILLPTAAIGILLIIAVFWFFRLPYSRPYLLSSLIISIASTLYAMRQLRHRQERTFLFAPNVPREHFPESFQSHIVVHNQPDWTYSHVSGVVVDLHQPLNQEWASFVADCSMRGINVLHWEQMYEQVTGKVFLGHLNEKRIGLFKADFSFMCGKRLFDLVVASSLLILLSPLMLLITVLIRRSDGGPAIYRQQRVGLGGKPFTVIKFRTMSAAKSDEARFASQDAARITPLGGWLRRSRVDELPQLLNVISGDMSLIGPRPEQNEIVAEYGESIPFYSYRHAVRPGISGWAQVVHGYADDADSSTTKLAYDLYYIKNLSLWMDLAVFLRTIWVVISGKGAQ